MVMVVMPSPEDGGDGEIMVMVVVQAIVTIDTCSDKNDSFNHHDLSPHPHPPPDFHYPYHPYQ